ncbi:MAG: hypothetical protein Q4D44_00405 [Eubacteriales bacterium]|nr:hypothetical protein [Eubacteriales bacterium]
MTIYQNPSIEPDEVPIAMKEAFRCFNDAFDTEYSEDNVKIAYCTFETFPQVYEDFCSKCFPSWLAEDYMNPAFYMDTNASALVEGENSGIIINTSVPFPFFEWVNSLTHELAHVYATRNEYHGQSFYEKHCCDPSLSAEEDMIYIGYQVWKEFIADYLTAYARPYMVPMTLYQLRSQIKQFDSVIRDLKPTSLKAITLVLVGIFTSREFLTSRDKEAFLSLLKEKKVVDTEEYKGLIRTVIDHLCREDIEPFCINEWFMDDIGNQVRSLVTGKQCQILTGKRKNQGILEL